MYNETTPFDMPDENGRELILNAHAEPLVLGDLLKKMGLRGTPIDAKSLIDTTFDIIRAKPFDSAFNEQDHAYYCLVKPVDSPELYSVTLGGGACVEILDALCKSDINQPIRVTLRYKEGGKFSGYYYFE